jgi:hypothetical protein
VLDANGREWYVEEILTSATSHDLPVRSLIAWNGTMVRRAWVYPGHWEQLEDAALLALMDEAARARRGA